MIFRNPEPMTREELERNFQSTDTDIITESLVALAFYEKDWRWAQNICLEFLEDSNPTISGLAAVCLGHIARIHHKLDKKKVLAALERRKKDPLTSGRIEDALSDISIFL